MARPSALRRNIRHEDKLTGTFLPARFVAFTKAAGLLARQRPRAPAPSQSTLRSGVMARILVAVVRGVKMDGTFVTICGDIVNLAGDVEEFCRALKDWSPGLAGVELRHIMVFGPWAEQPRVADVADLVGKEPRRAAAILGDVIGDKKCAYFIARIPASPPAAASGASGLAIVGLSPSCKRVTKRVPAAKSSPLTGFPSCSSPLS